MTKRQAPLHLFSFFIYHLASAPLPLYHFSFIIFHLAKRLLLPPCYPTPVGQPILPFQCRIAPTRKYSGGHIYIICTHAMRRRQRWGALTYCEQVKYRTQVLYETQAGVQAGGQLRRTREGIRPRTLEVEKKVKQQTNYLQLTLFINNPN